MATPYLQTTRMSIDAFMCLTKKERSGMMQTKIRPKTTAVQLQNTNVSRFAVVPDLEFLSFQQTKDWFANWKKASVGGANEGGFVEVTRACQWGSGEREVSKRYSRGRRSHPNL